MAISQYLLPRQTYFQSNWTWRMAEAIRENQTESYFPTNIFWVQLFTSLKADLCQDINGVFAFSRTVNRTFH